MTPRRSSQSRRLALSFGLDVYVTGQELRRSVLTKRIMQLGSALATAMVFASAAVAHHEKTMGSQSAHMLDHALWLLVPAAIIALAVGARSRRGA